MSLTERKRKIPQTICTITELVIAEEHMGRFIGNRGSNIKNLRNKCSADLKLECGILRLFGFANDVEQSKRVVYQFANSLEINLQFKSENSLKKFKDEKEDEISGPDIQIKSEMSQQIQELTSRIKTKIEEEEVLRKQIGEMVLKQTEDLSNRNELFCAMDEFQDDLTNKYDVKNKEVESLKHEVSDKNMKISQMQKEIKEVRKDKERLESIVEKQRQEISLCKETESRHLKNELAQKDQSIESLKTILNLLESKTK